MFSWPNEDVYVGQFLRDMCNGTAFPLFLFTYLTSCKGVGIQSYSDGRVYKGNWSNNRKNGYEVGVEVTHSALRAVR